MPVRACVCLCVLYLVRCDLYVWFLYSGKRLTAYFFTGVGRIVYLAVNIIDTLSLLIVVRLGHCKV